MEEIKKENYNEYVKLVTPTTNMYMNVLRAFISGGIICTIGQGIFEFLKYSGVNEKDAGSYQLLILMGIAILLTGLGIYQKIAKWAGAGTLVPITGFANSVAAAAIEYKKEGQVFGIGCKIFTIAGPVILYGILVSWVLGVIYWVLGVCGIM